MSNEYGIVIRKNLNPNDFVFDPESKTIRVKYPDNLGKQGKSSYDLWKERSADRTNKTIDDFIAFITGPKGDKGAPGEDGASVAFSGAVDTYAELPTLLGGGNAGDGYYNYEDNLLYVWDGKQFPRQGEGISISGEKGDDGDSAFEVWKSLDDTRVNASESEFIADIVGEKGDKGDSAYQVWKTAGNTGELYDYLEDIKGEQGDSAYQLWLDQGNTGTIGDFFADIKGPAGASAYQVWRSNGNTGTQEDFFNSLKGKQGISAYQVWLDQGNTGTTSDFFESLRGEQGPSAFDVFLAQPGNEDKTYDDFIDSLSGKSAYQVWVDQGNDGTPNDFLTSLKGSTGDKGDSAYRVWADSIGTESDPTLEQFYSFLSYKKTEQYKTQSLIKDGMFSEFLDFARDSEKLFFGGKVFRSVLKNQPVVDGSGLVIEQGATNLLPVSYYNIDSWTDSGIATSEAIPIVHNGTSVLLTGNNADSYTVLSSGSFSGAYETITVLIESGTLDQAILSIETPDGTEDIKATIDLSSGSVQTESDITVVEGALLTESGPNGGSVVKASVTVDTSAFTQNRNIRLYVDDGNVVFHHIQSTNTTFPYGVVFTDGESVTTKPDLLSGDLGTNTASMFIDLRDIKGEGLEDAIVFTNSDNHSVSLHMVESGSVKMVVSDGTESQETPISQVYDHIHMAITNTDTDQHLVINGTLVGSTNVSISDMEHVTVDPLINATLDSMDVSSVPFLVDNMIIRTYTPTEDQ